ncbi:MAG: peptidase M22 [Eubacterium sp.]|nr:peptidase M22 [Eubacterium sp.]
MYFGIDTSNYTTSLALFDGERVIQKKKLLCVKQGERGLRQSEAVFQHTVNLPKLLGELELSGIDAVGVSVTPRNAEGSYMPCFLVGENAAEFLSKGCGARLYKTSHQTGHILAALYSANRLDLVNKKHIAFHLSGGTTEALLVTPDKENIINIELIAQSSDLKAGQLIDRTGVMLGMNFPCGKELDLLSQKSDKDFKIKPSMKGENCSLSGVENKVKAMIENGDADEDIARFVITYICKTVSSMLNALRGKYGGLPVIFSGGVSSNSLLKKTFENDKSVYFAKPEFSLDNAAGTAIYAYLKDK